MDRNSEIAGFLRTRRARITPEVAGLPADGRSRRVPGLRREEAARLAGVSTEYYTRLEQGRAAHPSPEVIDALARALRLDAAEHEYLTDLLARPGGRRAPVNPQRVRQGLHLMLQTLEHVPAYIIGRRTDVLASNRLARAILTDFESLPVLRRNLARYYLLDPQARERTVDWERVACETVAMLRMEAGRCPGDRRLADLIGELTLNSTEFSTWWNDHRVLRRTHGAMDYRHPLVGDLHFSYESMQLPGDENQTLCVHMPEPGSATAESLRILSSWNATGAEPDHRPAGSGAAAAPGK
ncbi:helix-turn-helix transcriptional regulator [Streptomyces sp. NPDC059224]|uniref:helix-turn-helix transcriptional regulator n=1 Tax=Streptomyces sp. NPDC059224 TaxID=3346775 RepID=UPI0036B66AEF